jgi:hypothetical protein
MAKDFVDKCRTGIPGVKGLGGVTNESEWGERTATQRYGGGTRTYGPPREQSLPQELGDRNNLQGPRSVIDPNDWRRAGGGTAENRPDYVGGYRAPRGEPGERVGPPLRQGPGKKGPHAG